MDMEPITDHPVTTDPEVTTAAVDPLEKAEAKKETGQAAQDGLKGEAALDEAIADAGGDDVDPEATSAADDPLEKAEAVKESA
jgi:hypothetical protein